MDPWSYDVADGIATVTPPLTKRLAPSMDVTALRSIVPPWLTVTVVRVRSVNSAAATWTRAISNRTPTALVSAAKSTSAPVTSTAPSVTAAICETVCVPVPSRTRSTPCRVVSAPDRITPPLRAIIADQIPDPEEAVPRTSRKIVRLPRSISLFSPSERIVIDRYRASPESGSRISVTPPRSIVPPPTARIDRSEL